jgi:hypothetical protein
MERDNKRQKQPPRRVLFIGNSFTARNDVPGLVEEMAKQRGMELHTELVSKGGASLKQHWNSGVMQRHEKEPFDCIVLQEQSTLPGKNAASFHANVRLFAGAVHDAELVLYSTWARADEPAKQRVITDAYARIAEGAGARVAPVGTAFEALVGAGMKVHDKDKSHANLHGSYAAACVLFATLFPGESPLGLKSDKIKDRRVLEQLQQAAAVAIAK